MDHSAMATQDKDPWSLLNILAATRHNGSHHIIMWVYSTKNHDY